MLHDPFHNKKTHYKVKGHRYFQLKEFESRNFFTGLVNHLEYLRIFVNFCVNHRTRYLANFGRSLVTLEFGLTIQTLKTTKVKVENQFEKISRNTSLCIKNIVFTMSDGLGRLYFIS